MRGAGFNHMPALFVPHRHRPATTSDHAPVAGRSAMGDLFFGQKTRARARLRQGARPGAPSLGGQHGQPRPAADSDGLGAGGRRGWAGGG